MGTIESRPTWPYNPVCTGVLYSLNTKQWFVSTRKSATPAKRTEIPLRAQPSFFLKGSPQKSSVCLTRCLRQVGRQSAPGSLNSSPSPKDSDEGLEALAPGTEALRGGGRARVPIKTRGFGHHDRETLRGATSSTPNVVSSWSATDRWPWSTDTSPASKERAVSPLAGLAGSHTERARNAPRPWAAGACGDQCPRRPESHFGREEENNASVH